MPTLPRLRALALAALALVAVPGAAALAAGYPERPVRLIIPFPPGGSNDVVGRVVATGLEKRLGQQIIVDNRAGAGGVNGTQIASREKPDGYTLLLVSIAHTVNPSLYKLTYDPIKSFTPVSILATGPNVLAVTPSLPVKTTKDLIALAKQKPGELKMASAGIGSFQHLGGELFRLEAGINVLHVPFKGGGPSMISVMGGHTDFLLGSLIQVTPHLRSGKLRALGTGALKRTTVLPDVPPIADGLPGYEANNWWGILAPAGTPPAIVEKLHKEIAAVLKSDEVQKKFTSDGASTLAMSSAEFGKFIESEMKKWGRVVKDAGIKRK